MMSEHLLTPQQEKERNERWRDRFFDDLLDPKLLRKKYPKLDDKQIQEEAKLREDQIKHHETKARQKDRFLIAEEVHRYYELFGHENTPAWPFLMLMKYPGFRHIPLYQWEKIQDDIYMIFRTLRQHRSGL